MNNLFAALLAAFVSCASAAGTTSRCVLPGADGGGRQPSPPSVSGVLASADSGTVTFRSLEASKIIIGPRTEIFSVYGGFVESHELKEGLYASVWLQGCTPLAKSAQTAAVIQVCGTDAVPCIK